MHMIDWLVAEVIGCLLTGVSDIHFCDWLVTYATYRGGCDACPHDWLVSDFGVSDIHP